MKLRLLLTGVQGHDGGLQIWEGDASKIDDVDTPRARDLLRLVALDGLPRHCEAWYACEVQG